MSHHTVANAVRSSSVVPPGLFGNKACRFILLCEILSSPLSESFHSPYIRPIQKGQGCGISKTLRSIQNAQRTSVSHFFCVAAEKTFYDRCHRPSFSHGPNNISPVTVRRHINCIELPALPQFPRPASSQNGWGIEMKEVVADERWQQSLRGGWLSEDVMWARVPHDVSQQGERRGGRQRGEEETEVWKKGSLAFHQKLRQRSGTFWHLLASVESVFPSASDSPTRRLVFLLCQGQVLSLHCSSSGGIFVKIIEVRGGSSLV